MESTRSIYQGRVFRIEAIMLENGRAPVEEWLDSLESKQQQKFAALFFLYRAEGDSYSWFYKEKGKNP